MHRYTSILLIVGLVLGMAGCTSFDQAAAEEEIADIVAVEDGRLPSTNISFDLTVAESDSIEVDSGFILTGLSISTTFQSETLAFAFNQELKKDSLVTIGDSATVAVIRSYSGELTSTLKSTGDGTTSDAVKSFGSERVQYAVFADNDPWEMVAYTIAEERSDTNIARITHIELKGTGIDTTVYFPNAPAPSDSFPSLSPGADLTCNLRTTIDTSMAVCFMVGSEAVRFTPITSEEDKLDDRWEAEVTVGSEPLVIGIIHKDALADNDYPADIDLWILPVSD